MVFGNRCFFACYTRICCERGMAADVSYPVPYRVRSPSLYFSSTHIEQTSCGAVFCRSYFTITFYNPSYPTVSSVKSRKRKLSCAHRDNHGRYHAARCCGALSSLFDLSIPILLEWSPSCDNGADLGQAKRCN